MDHGVGVGSEEAVERGAGGRVGGLGGGLELVQGALAGGHEGRVLPPCGVLDDFVQGGAQDLPGPGGAAQGLGGHGVERGTRRWGCVRRQWSASEIWRS